MRVFIAIEFSDEAKTNIVDIRDRISEYSTAGNYTFKENLHLTIKFIGQIEKNNIKVIQDVMKNTAQSMKPFTFTLDSLGRFVRRRKSLIWLGTSDEIEELLILHRALDNGLSTHGFPKDKRSFTPHVTMGREINLTLPFNQLKESITVEPISIHVDSLTLMESTRVDGRLVYIPIYRCPLD